MQRYFLPDWAKEESAAYAVGTVREADDANLWTSEVGITITPTAQGIAWLEECVPLGFQIGDAALHSTRPEVG